LTTKLDHISSLITSLNSNVKHFFYHHLGDHVWEISKERDAWVTIRPCFDNNSQEGVIFMTLMMARNDSFKWYQRNYKKWSISDNTGDKITCKERWISNIIQLSHCLFRYVLVLVTIQLRCSQHYILIKAIGVYRIIIIFIRINIIMVNTSFTFFLIDQIDFMYDVIWLKLLIVVKTGDMLSRQIDT
jgi:hypothetical protein